MGVRAFPEPEAMRRGIVGVCKWGCGKPVPKPAIYWHKECFQQYALHTRLEQQKAFLLKRDGRRCAMVGCGVVPLKWQAGHAMALTVESIHFRATEPDMVAWAKTLWHRPAGRWADLTPEQRATGEQQSIERVCALEVDHRTPLWEVAHLPDDERRWYFGPENLWLLCPACHKAKTKREAADRAAQRRFAAAQPRLPL
jgi:5-methylcytosine-specific restriction endonuclease McrA